MALQAILLAVAAVAAVGSAVASAEAARVTNRNVKRAIIDSLDAQDSIDAKQRDVVMQLLPEVDQSAQTEFLAGKDKEIEDSISKTSKQNQSSRQADIAISGKITGLGKQRRADKKASEQRYNQQRYHLARFLAPNAVGNYLDPKLNDSASKIREYGVQKGAEGRIGQVEAEWQAQNSAKGLKGLSTALSIVSTIAGIGAGFTGGEAAAAGGTATANAGKDIALTSGGSLTMVPQTGASANTLVSGSLASNPGNLTLAGGNVVAPSSSFFGGMGQTAASALTPFAGASVPSASYDSPPLYNTSQPGYPMSNVGNRFQWSPYTAPPKMTQGLHPEYFRIKYR